MATDNQGVFREKLIALMAALNAGEGQDAYLIGMVGSFAQQAAKSTGAKDWADLKLRADMKMYDLLLDTFQKQGRDFRKQGDDKSVRALEILAISLISRHQQQPDLQPGISFLDRFIERCTAAYDAAKNINPDQPHVTH